MANVEVVGISEIFKGLPKLEHCANDGQDCGEKMVVSLLKIEMLTNSNAFDANDFYNGMSGEIWHPTASNVSSASQDDPQHCAE